MVNRNLIRNLDNDPELHLQLDREVGDMNESSLATMETQGGFEVNRIVEGRVIRVDEEQVLVDVGFKSEGTISRNEWDDSEEPPKIGDLIKVLIEELEDENAPG